MYIGINPSVKISGYVPPVMYLWFISQYILRYIIPEKINEKSNMGSMLLLKNRRIIDNPALR